MEETELISLLTPDSLPTSHSFHDHFHYVISLPVFNEETSEEVVEKSEAERIITKCCILKKQTNTRKSSVSYLDNAHRSLHFVNDVYGICELKEELTKGELQTILLDAIVTLLTNAKFDVDIIQEEQQWFIKIRVTEEAATEVASNISYKLRADGATISADPSGVISPLIPYNNAVEHSDAFASSREHGFVFQRYDEFSNPINSKTVKLDKLKSYSIFTELDRLSLLGHFLEDSFNVKGCIRFGFFSSYFPLHEAKHLSELTDWYSLKNILKLDQPVKEIKQYFGQEIGIYFEWLQYYNKALVLPSIIGFFLFVLQAIVEPDLSFSTQWMNITRCIWALFISCWMALFFQLWQQHEKEIFAFWGIEENMNERTRADFKDDGLTEHPIFPDRLTRSYSNWKHQLRHAASIILSSLLVIICSLGVNGDIHSFLFTFFGWEYYIGRMEGIRKALTELIDIPTIITAILVFLFELGFSHIVEGLVHFENHRFVSEATSSEIMKMFAFRSVDYYSPLFYFAFFKVHVDSFLLVPEDPGDPFCLKMLRRQLISLFLIGFILTFLEVFLPYYRFWKISKAKVSSIESLQANMDEYESSVADYEELMTQLGLVSLFSMILPITPLLALMSNLLEMKADAFKLAKAYRRPNLNQEVSHISAWKDIMRFFSLLSLFVNISLCVFSTMGRHFSLRKKLTVCTILVTVGFCLREIVISVVPEERSQITRLKLKRVVTLQQIIWGGGEKEPVLFVY